MIAVSTPLPASLVFFRCFTQDKTAKFTSELHFRQNSAITLWVDQNPHGNFKGFYQNPCKIPQAFWPKKQHLSLPCN